MPSTAHPFTHSACARAIAVALASFAAGLIATPTAVQAQSNASGTIYGTVPSSDGSSVLIENVDTGAKRTVIPDASGRFQATALSPGQYRVQLLKGSAVASTVSLEVLIGKGVEAVFAVAGTDLQQVRITGARTSIDTSTTNSSSNFTAQELSKLPIGQDVTSIILLAPGTVRADPRYAGGASIGGGAPSENSYYINGFPVTNPLSQLGSIELPFGAIQQAQILTGGFGAEFGRSTGGVVNITTKSGTNKWEGGASYYIEPNALRSREKNIYYPTTSAAQNALTDGKLYAYNHDDTKTETKYGAYLGGPLIPDKLFMFLAADQTTQKRSTLSNGTALGTGFADSSTLASNGFEDLENINRRYLAKLDWHITDEHRIELTALGDNYYTQESDYAFDYSTLSRGTTKNYSATYTNQPNLTTGVGGSAQILRYIGNLTQDLTLTALAGQSKSPHKQLYTPDLSGSVPGVIFSTESAKLPGVVYNAQPLSGQNISAANAEDTTRSYRLDLEYAIGKHTIRVGLDENKLKSENAGDASAGGSVYSYRITTTPTATQKFGPYTYVVADGSPLGNQGYYVRQRTFSDLTNARSDQSAQYIEDRYLPVKDLLLTLGVRNESFKGYNGEGKTYIDSKNFVSPRLGAAWNAFGDNSLKVFGNAGRYSIQTPTHVAVRGAGVSTLVDQYFTYTGVNPANGLPLGLAPLTPAPFSPDGETGQAKDPNSVAAKDLKPSYQDELILGFEKAVAKNLTFGAKGTYRRLGATLDDMCDERPFDKYADDHGIDRTNYSFSCLSINPGRTNKFLVDYAGTKTYTNVSLTAADMGFDSPKRTYLALDLFLEHSFAENWYGKLIYTFSHSRGNTEGQTKSDNGQTDVSATSTWDFHEIMENSYGYLPSDRTHQIKAIGYFQALPEWGVGGNLVMASGRPKNCIGNYGGSSPDGDYGGYGSIFFYCNGVATPRGSQGRLPWEYTFDANLIYQPAYAKGVQLRVDVFNLFNRQSVQAISEIHETDGDANSVLPTYGRVISYADPRAVRLTAQYDF